MHASAAEYFYHCLLDMAEAETNPVLEVIDIEKPLEENKKYPAGLLQFNQTGWRAYYHCHPASRSGNHRLKGEHGHFHIFVRTHNKPDKWSHLVALSIDKMGQPLGWFTVNQWVTGEEWESAEALTEYVKDIPFAAQNTLIESWLLSLLDLSREMIIHALQKRDELIKEKQNEIPSIDVKKDKGIYLLSASEIKLKELLESKVNNN